MFFSVIVPAYNAQKSLPRLLDSLICQSYKDFEVVIIDDCSKDSTSKVVQSFPYRLIKLAENHGPAYCRNLGSKNAHGEILVFTDSDCRVDRHWLNNIEKHFSQNDIDAIMGRLVIIPSTLLGDSISALGFPAGGSLGFEKIWRVNKDGFTDSLSSCNCAIKRDIFLNVGGFDETFPFPGGEDSLLAYSLRKSNYRIKYCQDIIAYHEARDSFRDFIEWQFKRGVSSYIYAKKIFNKKDYFSLRLWSTKNIIRKNISGKKLPLILFLLATSFFVQMLGFILAKHNRNRYESSDH